MQLNDFQELVMKAKLSYLYSNSFDLKVGVNKERTQFRIANICKCQHCKHTEQRQIIVLFKRRQELLTIFQAGMLYALFSLNKRLVDYACYHKCKSGQEFIENLDSVKIYNPIEGQEEDFVIKTLEMMNGLRDTAKRLIEKGTQEQKDKFLEIIANKMIIR